MQYALMGLAAYMLYAAIVMGIGFAATYGSIWFVVAIKSVFDDNRPPVGNVPLPNAAFLVLAWAVFYSFALLHAQHLSSDSSRGFGGPVRLDPILIGYFATLFAVGWLAEHVVPKSSLRVPAVLPAYLVLSFMILVAVPSASGLDLFSRALEFAFEPVRKIAEIQAALHSPGAFVVEASRNAFPLAALGWAIGWVLKKVLGAASPADPSNAPFLLGTLLASCALYALMFWFVDGGGIGRYAAGPAGNDIFLELIWMVIKSFLMLLFALFIQPIIFVIVVLAPVPFFFLIRALARSWQSEHA